MGGSIPLSIVVLIMHGRYGQMAFTVHDCVSWVRVLSDSPRVVHAALREIPERTNDMNTMSISTQDTQYSNTEYALE